jgi:hypothetical protein
MLYSAIIASVPKLVFTKDELDVAIKAPVREKLVQSGYLKPMPRITKQECYRVKDVEAALDAWERGEIGAKAAQK